MRLRQVALVAHDLAAAEAAVVDALGVELCFRDPSVATFGLHNALFPIGDKLLEVVSPTEGGTTAGRLLEKRGGDGGYMVLVQTADVEAHRRYHTLAHLEAVLAVLDELHAPAAPPAASRAAAWYHDAVYDPRGAGNEAASAELARRRLGARGVAPGLVGQVAALVLATAGHEPPPGVPGAAELLDADLAVLAADAPAYADYVAGVRAEYAHLDEAAFRRGRAAVLRSLVDRPALFRSPRGAARFEARARANLAGELAELSRPAEP